MHASSRKKARYASSLRRAPPVDLLCVCDAPIACRPVLQDHDGSHIKGLLINFLHAFWPSLLKQPNFLLEFITPIVKVSKGGVGREGGEETREYLPWIGRITIAQSSLTGFLV